MGNTITFTPQVLGETEKALNAILYRELGHVDLTEHQWIVLRLTVTGGGEVGREQLVGRLAGALKVETHEARARVDELVAAGLLQEGAERVAVTEAGAQVHGRVRGAVEEITTRLWGDLPADDLETTGRTLATILARANAEFAA
jgi:DNA-binding MarR family transcriptional regulator